VLTFQQGWKTLRNESFFLACDVIVFNSQAAEASERILSNFFNFKGVK